MHAYARVCVCTNIRPMTSSKPGSFPCHQVNSHSAIEVVNLPNANLAAPTGRFQKAKDDRSWDRAEDGEPISWPITWRYCWEMGMERYCLHNLHSKWVDEHPNGEDRTYSVHLWNVKGRDIFEYTMAHGCNWCEWSGGCIYKWFTQSLSQ